MGGLRSQQVGHIFLKEQSHQVVENTRQVSGIGQNKPDESILSRDGYVHLGLARRPASARARGLWGRFPMGR